jgi:hypothetical protein
MADSKRMGLIFKKVFCKAQTAAMPARICNAAERIFRVQDRRQE